MALRIYVDECVQERELPRDVSGVRSFDGEFNSRMHCVYVFKVFCEGFWAMWPDTEAVIDVSHVHARLRTAVRKENFL